MVVPSASPSPHQCKLEKPRIPIIDLSLRDKSKLCQLILTACQDFGFFLVQNHGIPGDIISRLEREALDFFSKPECYKQQARARAPALEDPPTRFGYGRKTIGFNGDVGADGLEYIILEANPHSISQRSKTIAPDNPTNFSCAMNEYIEAVRRLACDILEMAAEGLQISDKFIFSNLILDANNDSFFRINHYPGEAADGHDPPKYQQPSKTRTSFGEHSDLQILTILRSNDVGGLQIQSRDDGLWIPIPPDSDKFCVFVGDTFQALTNGRFVSVRHRVTALNSNNKSGARMSTMYFAAPAVDAQISSIPQLVSYGNPRRYRGFTWGEYKATAYSVVLAAQRLDLFRKQQQEN